MAKAKSGAAKKSVGVRSRSKTKDLTAPSSSVKGGRTEVTREQWEKLAATRDFDKR
jgi:hypothetical protein